MVQKAVPVRVRVLAVVCASMLAVSTLAAGVLAEPQARSKKDVGTLEIELSGFEHSKGDVKIALYTSDAADAFPDEWKKARRFIKVPIKAKRAFLAIPNLPYGVYAVSAFHDEDGDGQLNTAALLGIPTEGVGASRNPGGKPDFDESRFRLNGVKHRVKIKMTYVF